MSNALSKASICVFCGSSSGTEPVFTAAAAELGKAIGNRGLRLIYGGASVGLMGTLASSTLGAGGEAIGVLPRVLMAREIAHPSLTELEIVDSMLERKSRMADLATGFVVLPGGGGTLDELFEVFTWAQLGLHQKPIVILEVAGYFVPLLEFLDRAVASGFISRDHRAILRRATSAEEALALATSCN